MADDEREKDMQRRAEEFMKDEENLNEQSRKREEDFENRARKQAAAGWRKERLYGVNISKQGMKAAAQNVGRVGAGAVKWAAPKAGAGLMGGLAIGGAAGAAAGRAMAGNGIFFILLSALLYLSDIYITGFNGIDITLFLQSASLGSAFGYIGYIFNSFVVIIALGYYFLARPSGRELVSFVMIIMLSSTIFFMGGFDRGLFHLIFVIIVYVLFIKPSSQDAATSNFIVFGLMLFDFFGYGILTHALGGTQNIAAAFVSNRLLLPVWFYYSLIFTHEHEKGWLASALIIIVIILNVFYFAQGMMGATNFQSVISQEQRQGLFDGLKTSVSNMLKAASQISTNIQKNLEQRVMYAVTGKVEENKYEPLGVYLENVKSLDPKYYARDTVTIVGTVKARTLDDPINIKLGCFREKNSQKAAPDKIQPDKTFSIYTLEEQDFVCQFKTSDTDVGAYSITATANFNFDTLAYLKAYFMDRERYRAMTREGLDPLDEFGIKDKKPVAAYTNGPVGIDMSTTSALTGVGEQAPTLPRLNINLVNRPGWEGKIDSIREFVVLLPAGISIEKPAESCTRPFKEYSKSECLQSCVTLVEKPCTEACAAQLGDGRTKCEASCRASTKDRCEPSCTDLFVSDEGNAEYKAYALDVGMINSLYGNELKNIDKDRFRSFSCELSIDSKAILGNTPITTKFFRARARYEYTVEKKTSVNVEKVPEPISASGAIVVPPGLNAEGDAKKKIIETARDMSADSQLTALALAIAHHESRGSFKHCKSGGISCNTQDQVECSSANSCGLMQINRDVHPLQGYGCGQGQTIFDAECNIRTGIRILQDNYNNYGNNNERYAGAVTSNCKDLYYQRTYLNYQGWDRAIRAYNGLGCNATRADRTYVESVKRYWEGYKKFDFGRSAKAAPPTNIAASAVSGGIMLTWALSADDGNNENDISNYYILVRESTDSAYGDIAGMGPQTAEYTDNSVQPGKTYCYKVRAYDKEGNFADSSTEACATAG